MIDTSKPSIVHDMPFAEYLADPCDMPSLQSSTVRSLHETAPLGVWTHTMRLNPDAEEEHKTAFDLGTAAHAMLIGGGGRIAVIPFDSYRTAEAKALRDAAYAEGATPVLEPAMDKLREMVHAAREQFRWNPDIAFAFDGTHKPVHAEASIFWRNAGVACRCRPDLFTMRDKTPVVVHYKTTAVTLNGGMLSRYAGNAGWDVTTAHYSAGLKALTGRAPEQYFAVQEIDPPYLAIVCRLEQAFVENGKMTRNRAIRTWAACLNADRWPGHIARTMMVSLPPWHENAHIEAKDRENAIERETGKSVLELSAGYQT